MRRLLFGNQLRRLGWKPAVEAEVDQELRHHVELLIADGIQRGLTPVEAERQAIARFGTDPAVRKICQDLARSRDRQQYRSALLADGWDDLRWTWRSLRRSPAYTISSGLTLGLVVAANALVFTLVYGILLRPLPYPHADRLVALNEQIPAGDLWEVSLPNFQAIQGQAGTFEGLAGWYRTEATLRNEATPRIALTLVTGDFFSVLPTAPLLGRTLMPTDQAATEGKALVLSEGAWRTHFGADRSVLGRGVTVNAEQFTVVGVMPATFRFPHPDVAAWVPWGQPQDWMQNRSVHLLQVVGRLRSGESIGGAAAELATVMNRIQSQHPGEDPEHTILVRDLKATLTGNARLTLFLLLGSVGAVLLLACANLAGLTVTRTAARQGELSLRAALGASRWRLTRQLVVESLLLGIGAGLAGLVLAGLLLDPLLGFLPASVPRPGRLALDLTVAGYTLGLAAFSGLLIGLLAALRAARQDPAARLRADSSASTLSVERLRLQRVLVGTQVALSLILLTGGGLLLRSFREVIGQDPGYRTERVLTAMVSLPASRYSSGQVTDWYRELPARLERIRGVEAASAVNSLPMSGDNARGDLTVEGQPFVPGQAPAVVYRRILPNFFRTMGIPLIRGREFSDQDRGEGAPIVIISQSMAERFWPGQDPLGRRIKIGPADGEPWLTVVGVVGDVRYAGLEEAPRLETYEPHAQRPRATMGIVVRTGTDPSGLAGSIRAGLRETDAEIPVWDLQSLELRLSGSLAARRFTTAVIAGFGAAALLLAAIGVYGVTAYGVSRRRREFAIRMALGAHPAQVRGQVLRESLRVAAVGVLAGLPAGLLLTRMIRAMLFEVSPGDPLVYGSAVVLLGAVVVIATWWPARSATRTDPVAALRE